MMIHPHPPPNDRVDLGSTDSVNCGAPVDSSRTGGVTLSIVSHRQGHLVARLLDDLNRLAPAHVTQVILTLNVPEPRPAVDDLPWPVLFLENSSPLGFSANHNQAFRHATHSTTFGILNPDLRLASDPFPALLRALSQPGVGLTSPVVLETDGRVADFARPLATPSEILRRRLGLEPSQPLGPRHDWVAGMFLMVRSDTFRSLGGFDERYRLYCEDIDFSARIRLAGLSIRIADDARVVHAAQRASRRSWQHLRWHVASLLRWWTSPTYRQFRRLLGQTRRSIGAGNDGV
jgi:GT2 family glycosyltransferase